MGSLGTTGPMIRSKACMIALTLGFRVAPRPDLMSASTSSGAWARIWAIRAGSVLGRPPGLGQTPGWNLVAGEGFGLPATEFPFLRIELRTAIYSLRHELRELHKRNGKTTQKGHKREHPGRTRFTQSDYAHYLLHINPLTTV